MMEIHAKSMAKLAGLQHQIFLPFLKCLLLKIDLMEASTTRKEGEAKASSLQLFFIYVPLKF